MHFFTMLEEPINLAAKPTACALYFVCSMGRMAIEVRSFMEHTMNVGTIEQIVSKSKHFGGTAELDYEDISIAMIVSPELGRSSMIEIKM